ncbi:MAG: hypothetical protein QG604_800 [Candidatus Dependentiae bacterium]|nr:hypothetical protein [Candidatus Dependentiae bacterium]
MFKLVDDLLKSSTGGYYCRISDHAFREHFVFNERFGALSRYEEQVRSWISYTSKVRILAEAAIVGSGIALMIGKAQGLRGKVAATLAGGASLGVAMTQWKSRLTNGYMEQGEKALMAFLTAMRSQLAALHTYCVWAGAQRTLFLPGSMSCDVAGLHYAGIESACDASRDSLAPDVSAILVQFDPTVESVYKGVLFNAKNQGRWWHSIATYSKLESAVQGIIASWGSRSSTRAAMAALTGAAYNAVIQQTEALRQLKQYDKRPRKGFAELLAETCRLAKECEEMAGLLLA